jgi:hypothetical protein
MNSLSIKEKIGTVAAGLGGAFLSLFLFTGIGDWYYCNYQAFSDASCPASNWSFLLEKQVLIPALMIFGLGVAIYIRSSRLFWRYLVWWLLFSASLWIFFRLQGKPLS